ncbi:DPBB_1 domain-containing protein [Dispira simplex]|nr:DPBB_1 domain-containing protein [Dispira simplex]
MAGSIVTFTCTLLTILALCSDRCAGRQSPLSSVINNESPFKPSPVLSKGGDDSSLDESNPNRLDYKNPDQDSQIRDSIEWLISLLQEEENRTPAPRAIVLPGGLSKANNAVPNVTENPPGRETRREKGETRKSPLSKPSLAAKRTAPQSNDGETPSRKRRKPSNNGSLNRKPLKNMAEQTSNESITRKNPPNTRPPKMAQLIPVTKLHTPAPKLAAPVANSIKEATPKFEALPPNKMDSAPASATAQKSVEPQNEPKLAEAPPAVALDPQPFAPKTVSPESEEDMILAPLSTGKSEMYHGDITYFEGGLGACGIPFTNGEYIAAIHESFFTNEANPNDDVICERQIKITLEGKSVTVTILDKLPEGKRGDIDLTEGAFTQLNPKEVGRFQATWEFVS